MKSFMICADQSKKNEIGRSRGTHRKQETCEQGFGGGRDGKIPLGILGLRWEDNIKRNLQEEGCENRLD